MGGYQAILDEVKSGARGWDVEAVGALTELIDSLHDKTISVRISRAQFKALVELGYIDSDGKPLVSSHDIGRALRELRDGSD